MSEDSKPPPPTATFLIAISDGKGNRIVRRENVVGEYVAADWEPEPDWWKKMHPFFRVGPPRREEVDMVFISTKDEKN